jgi:alpha-mannosidase
MLHPGEAAPRSDIEEAWRNIIMGTEHTWCFMDPSKQPITNDILKVKFGFFEKGEKLSKSLMTIALTKVNEEGSPVIGVFNTLSWNRSGLVHVPPNQSTGSNSIIDEKGKTVLSQQLSTGELLFMASDVPAFGSKNYILLKKKNKVSGSFAQGNILDNGLVKVIIDPQTGDISSLVYKTNEYSGAKTGIALNNYRYLHGDDSPDKAIGTKDVKISIEENGPLIATILVESKAEGCNSLRREISVIAGQPYIEIKNTIDKQAITAKEGVHFGFGFNISNPVTRVDIPWGIMELEKDQLSAANRNWIAFQRWLDISGKDNGITFCSLDAPVFESGAITANILGGATNSLKWMRKLQPSATIYSWALNNHWHTNFPLSQEGIIQFRYRILPHDSKYDAGSANRFGLEQSQPLIAIPVQPGIASNAPVSVEGSSNILITILKTGDTGGRMKLRLRSVSAKDETVKLKWNERKPASVRVADLSDNAGNIEVHDEILVPAMGFVTLDVVW